MHYLQFHKGTWRVRRVVPPALVEKIGKATLLRGTGTDDFDRAMKIARPIIREHDRVINRAAGKPLGRVHVRHSDPTRRSSEWLTPPTIFEKMAGVEFDLDVAAPLDLVTFVPAKRHLTVEDDGLTAPWNSAFVWMNCPFGVRAGMVRWLDRFVEHGNGVAILPSNSYVRWFQDFSRKVDMMLLIAGYVAFIPGGQKPKNTNSRPSFGSVLFAIGDRGVAALRTAAADGLGILFEPRNV